jgi:hypothetical protein
MTLWYLSFAAETEFLGATIVEAEDAKGALAEATDRGLNPGGQVAMFEVEPGAENRAEARGLLNRLCDLEEMRRLGHKQLKELPPDERPAIGEIACEECNPKPY